MASRLKTIWYCLPTLTSGVLQDWDQVWIWNGSTYSDETVDSNNSGTADVTFSGTVDSAFYFGMTNTLFDFMRFVLSTNGAGGVLAWEYWNGSSWASLSITTITGNANLTASPTEIKWTPPDDWIQTAVNGVTAYWVRARVTTAYTTTPVGSEIDVGTICQWPTKTIYIPETSGRTFRSVIFQYFYHTNQTVANTAINHRISIKLGSGSWTYLSTQTNEIEDIANTGEHSNNVIVFDAATAFSSGFGSGSSQTIDVRASVAFPAIATPEAQVGRIDDSILIGITYQYDDSATTRIKTVIIPIESTTSTISNTLSSIGTNQIPALNTFLAESSKTYRDIFFEFGAFRAISATDDSQLAVALDSESEYTFGTMENALNSNCYDIFLWSRIDMSPDSTHDLKARNSAGTNRHLWFGALLYVTYEYDHSNSSSITNSIQIPINHEPGWYSGTTTADATCESAEFFIEEPGTITLLQSGVSCHLASSAALTNVYVACGSQSYRTYTDGAQGVACGQRRLIQRIDSGGAQGAGISLSRGLNTITIKTYATGTMTNSAGFNSVLYLNYSSGKSSDDAKHNHTVYWRIRETSPDTSRIVVSAWAPTIPETNYYLSSVGYLFIRNTDTAGMLLLTAERQSGEGVGDGWEELFATYEGFAELSIQTLFANASFAFRRYPQDPDSKRMNFATSRRYIILDQPTTWFGLISMFTYHSITYTVSGAVSGYTGDGSSITVEVHRTDTDEKILNLTTASGGGFSGTWYDNTIALYAHARQDSTHTGRSDDGTAT